MNKENIIKKFLYIKNSTELELSARGHKFH